MLAISVVAGAGVGATLWAAAAASNSFNYKLNPKLNLSNNWIAIQLSSPSTGHLAKPRSVWRYTSAKSCCRVNRYTAAAIIFQIFAKFEGSQSQQRRPSAQVSSPG